MKKKGNRTYVKTSYRWHRRIGLFIAIPALIVAVTGIVLNHSKSINLDQIYITNKSILRWYGMSPKTKIQSLESEKTWVSTFEHSLYLNQKRVLDDVSELKGVTSFTEFLVVATTDSLLLFTKPDLQFIEKISSELLPEGEVVSIEATENRLLLDTTQGEYYSKNDISSFNPDKRKRIASTKYSTLPKNLENQILVDWRGKGLSLWRVILDIHSGSIFGNIGIFFADIAALCIVLLVLSGFYNWSKRPTR